MIYDFSTPVNRRGTDCVKWDEAVEGELPMWVADMDFETAPCVQEAILCRARHGIYGYSLVPETFYSAIIDWQCLHHGWHIERDWVLYTSGVVPAVSAIIKGLCREGDGVMTFTPAYNCFFSSIRNNGCSLVDFPLSWDAEAERYTIDFDEFEKAVVSKCPRLFLLCSPHNPTGRVWTHEELLTIATICRRHDVIVLSDEIHCEFVNPALSRRFLPFAPVADEVGCQWVVANAPNKAFNIAGLQTAYIITSNEEFRLSIDRAINDNEVCDINCFSFVALQAAYSDEGAEWLGQLITYIYEGYRIFRDTLKCALSALPIAPLEGTYLAWIDVRQFLSAHADSSERLSQYIREQEKLWINPGEMYGQKGFLRVNLATQHDNVRESARRIIKALKR